jgi:hypothetical protein
LMSFRKHAVSAVFAAMFIGNVGSALAQGGGLANPNPGVVVEIYVHDGETEIVCPTTACNAICRDIEGTQVLLADTYYRIGSNCSLTITDGALLQAAIETLLALLGDENPTGNGLGQPGTPNDFQNQESNPNQTNPPVQSSTQAGPVISP